MFIEGNTKDSELVIPVYSPIIDKLEIADAEGVMRDVTEAVETARFNDPQRPQSILPVFGPSGVAKLKAYKTGKELANALRHHAQSYYDEEWKYLRNCNVPNGSDVWRKIAIALCVQVATETVIMMEALDCPGYRYLMEEYVENKLQEHTEDPTATITPDFFENAKAHLDSGEAYYERRDTGIKILILAVED